MAGQFTATPQGVILHGSRSGSQNDTLAEYRGTARYAGSGIELGWHATIGDDLVSIHMDAKAWGWNARGASQRYLAVEFAQATADRPVSDAQVRAFCWWLDNMAKAAWPSLPFTFPTHAELPEGKADGKTDVFPVGDARADELRSRIMARLGFSQPAPAQGPDIDVAGDWIRDTTYSMEPDHAFTLAELWSDIQRFSGRYQADPKILAGMIQQESTFRNLRVHLDKTGHGLLGLDDNGLRKDFEAWSGLYIGPGTTANIVPVEPQLEFAARQLRRYQDAYPNEGPYIGAQAWHAGGGGRNNANGKNYALLIQQRIRDLGLS